jgi:hypothetical protein
VKGLAKLKRLSTIEDNLFSVILPASAKEVSDRTKEYDILTQKKFGTKFKNLLFASVKFSWNGKTYIIQYNHCANPFCKWHGMPQEKFPVKGKPSRYRLSGTDEDKSIFCNPDPIAPTRGMALDCNTKTLSNCSIAE